MAEAKAKPKTQGKRETSKIQFFGEVDLNDQGGITSDMPAWYLERHIEYLEEDLTRKRNALKKGTLEADQIPRIKEEVKQEEAKLAKIKSSKPELTSSQKDRCLSTYEDLSRQIKETLPTRKQTKDGLVNPYDEFNRNKTKHIKIDPAMASSLGVRPVDGKISGDEANKCYQILGKVLGESTNVESLRRDGRGEAYQTMHDLTQAILGGKK